MISIFVYLNSKNHAIKIGALMVELIIKIKSRAHVASILCGIKD